MLLANLVATLFAAVTSYLAHNKLKLHLGNQDYILQCLCTPADAASTAPSAELRQHGGTATSGAAGASSAPP